MEKLADRRGRSRLQGGADKPGDPARAGLHLTGQSCWFCPKVELPRGGLFPVSGAPEISHAVVLSCVLPGGLKTHVSCCAGSVFAAPETRPALSSTTCRLRLLMG